MLEVTAPAEPASAKLALAGVRVLDLSKYWAGPALTEVLGNMGAEIIKVEAIQAPDNWRMGGARLAPVDDGETPPYEASPIFNSVNRNKYGLTLDLTRPRGQELFKRLVPEADVIVENYTPRVMPKFGLQYDALRELNEGLVMISLPAFGSTGPWREFVGFAYPTEQSTGFPQMMGYEDGKPMLWGCAGADSIAGMTGVTAVLAALEYRRRTGRGQWIDLSQAEAITTFLGQPMLDYCFNGRLWPRRGNAHATMAPHGCYRSAGEDAWVVVAVEDDTQFRRLCDVLERPDWAARGDLGSAGGRRDAHAELDEGIEAWTARRNHYEAAAELQDSGVAAAPVLTGPEVLHDPHLNARGFFERSDRRWTGEMVHNGMWAKFSRTPGGVRMPAPLLGEHNDLILRGMLGLGDEELAELARERIVGTEPNVGAAW